MRTLRGALPKYSMLVRAVKQTQKEEMNHDP